MGEGNANQWAFYISLATFASVVFKALWDDYIHRRDKREAREEADLLKAKADKAVQTAMETKQEIVAAVSENTELTKKAIKVANNTHDKIVHIGAKRNELFDMLTEDLARRNRAAKDTGDAA